MVSWPKGPRGVEPPAAACIRMQSSRASSTTMPLRLQVAACCTKAHKRWLLPPPSCSKLCRSATCCATLRRTSEGIDAKSGKALALTSVSHILHWEQHWNRFISQHQAWQIPQSLSAGPSHTSHKSRVETSRTLTGNSLTLKVSGEILSAMMRNA